MSAVDIYSSPLSALVPTSEVELPEVDNSEALQDALSRIMVNELPGFTIRSSGLDGSPVNNRVLVAAVQNSLTTLGRVFEMGYHLSGAIERPDLGLGNLHIDLEVAQPVSEIALHTTVSGGGKVVIAESGKGVERVLRHDRHSEEHKAQAKLLGGHLVQDRTDPEIILPTLHTTLLGSGDHVVFALANNRGPVWHRFDTDSSSREIDVSVMVCDEVAEFRLML